MFNSRVGVNVILCLQYPSDVLAFLHKNGLHIACNLHDDNGVLATDKVRRLVRCWATLRASPLTVLPPFPYHCPWTQMHDALATYLGLPTTVGDISFSMVNKSYVYGLQDIVLGDVVKQGMDFWWTDWQQGGKEGGCNGGKQNPTIWTDKQVPILRR